MLSIFNTLPILAFALYTSAAPVYVTITACGATSTSTAISDSNPNTSSTSTSTSAVSSPTLKNHLQNSPSLPSTNAGTQLPASNLTLQHITLGHGIQNYTCASPSSVPVAVGALATLYDITTVRSSAISFLSDMLPSVAVYMPLPAAPSTPLSAPFSSTGIHIPAGTSAYPVIGHHYFNADGVPTFDLRASAEENGMLCAKKLAGIKAPALASRGPEGTGAVDWLFLGNSGKGTFGSSSQVYRVVTAGGSPPPSCMGYGDNGLGVGMITVPYAAEYWFYG